VLAVAGADAEELEPALAAAVASGGSIAALEEAEAARLVAVEAGRVRFHHPLVRSAVLAAASPSERRAAHRAYAEALADGDAEERRAWHAAAGTVAPSEPVAAALATAGARAAGRGGHATCIGCLPAGGPADARRGAPRGAPARGLRGGLAGRRGAAGAPAARRGRAPAGRSRARAAAAPSARSRARAPRPDPAAVRVLRGAAAVVEGDDPARASEILAEATYAAIYGGVAEGLEAMARRAAALAPEGHMRARCLAASALGAALVLLARPDATARLREAGGPLGGSAEESGPCSASAR
jgi:hypothetical protein